MRDILSDMGVSMVRIWAGHSIFYKIICAPSKDSNLPAHPRSLMRVFTKHFVGSQESKAASSGGQRRLWSTYADALSDLSPYWTHVQSCIKLCPGSFPKVPFLWLRLVKRNGYTFRGKWLFQKYFVSLLKRDLLSKERICPLLKRGLL